MSMNKRNIAWVFAICFTIINAFLPLYGAIDRPDLLVPTIPGNVARIRIFTQPSWCGGCKELERSFKASTLGESKLRFKDFILEVEWLDLDNYQEEKGSGYINRLMKSYNGWSRAIPESQLIIENEVVSWGIYSTVKSIREAFSYEAKVAVHKYSLLDLWLPIEP